MTTLRYLRFNDGCTLPRGALIPPAAQRVAQRRAGVRRRALARALRVAGEVLFGLWAITALAFGVTVAVAMVLM
jgi:hypothetical protein